MLLTLAAVTLPLMWAHQAPPLPAFYSQWLASLLWSLVSICASYVAVTASDRALRGGNSLATANSAQLSLLLLWVLLIGSLLTHVGLSWTPSFIALPTLFSLVLAAALCTAVVQISRCCNREFMRRWLSVLLLGVLIAALYNTAVALIQTVAPNWTNENWIASISADTARYGAERAGGNLRQPNQLATLMIWGLLAATYLLRRSPWLWGVACLPLLLALFATGSRVGVLSLALIVGVALVRSRRARSWQKKAWLMAGLTALVLAWFAASAFTRDTAESALSQRLALWRDVWTIVEHSPWFGVGWGQLNFAWTLTPLPARAPDVFDHAHSLPLHLAAELGLPLATCVMALLGLTLWFSRRAGRTREGATAQLMLATILLHSLFEYPLWFAYFLLPSAFLLAWLVAAGNDSSPNQKREVRLRPALPIATSLVAATCIAAALYAWNEYEKISSIYQQAARSSALSNAAAEARKSRLYGQFGDYAAIMIAGSSAPLAWFARPIRQVLDERLLTAYAKALSRAGETDKAAFIVARAREFPPQPVFADLPVIAPSGTASAPLGPHDFRR
ncbi:MAG: Wzy polymerase domain-containing protein [Casimicrobium sp.]